MPHGRIVRQPVLHRSQCLYEPGAAIGRALVQEHSHIAALLVHVRLSHWSNFYCTVCSTVGDAGAYQPRAAGSPQAAVFKPTSTASRVVCSRAPRTDYRKPPLRASSTSNGPGRKQVVYAARTVRDGTITRWRIRHGPCGTVHIAYGTRCMRHGERGTAHAAQCMRDGARGAVYKARCIRLGPCGTAHPTRCKRHGASGTVYAARCTRHGACSTVHAARRTRDGACGTVHEAQCS